MYSAFFFDMDGVLFDSMPHHALAWEQVMAKYDLNFTARDTYLQEGRTGASVITECYLKKYGVEPTPEFIQQVYAEKTAAFEAMGEVEPIAGVAAVLNYLHEQGKCIWIVTGSGQESLFDKLSLFFPNIFTRERMITAFDVTKGKPDPEPYLLAWERSGFAKEECCVVENAPLGVRSGKAAGLYTIAVNTGILTPADLLSAGADAVFDDMPAFLLDLHKNYLPHKA